MVNILIVIIDVFAPYTIPTYWNDAYIYNYFSSRSKSYACYISNFISVDELGMQRPRALAVIVSA